MSDRELLVSKIENGIVIDHIPAGRAFQVLRLLKLPGDARALIAQNVPSGSMGSKDLIKVEGTYLTSSEIDVIAFVAPDATLNIISDWQVKEKRVISLPGTMEGTFNCPNTLCPTNARYGAPNTVFRVEKGNVLEETKLHCTLCGSVTYYGTIRDSIQSESFRIERRGLVNKGKIESVFLDVLIKGGALRFPRSPDQPFMLKSGRPSPYFVNLGALTDGESLGKLKWAFASYIALLVEEGKIPDFDYVFGPSYKGISLAALTCEGLNELYGMDKRYMYDRKEAKDYGDLSADRVLVGSGYFKPGQRLLVVDDTITTGITKVETIEKLRMLGDHEVVGLVIAVDRQERLGDKENVEDISAVQYLERELGLRVHSIQNISTIYGLIKGSLSEEMRRLWLQYYGRYGTVKLE
ncbi:aspartate carbamoyltransferase regulatory subunit [Candidatus Bathyarchaeota archaeon]|nr:aspartate carbamoyltransferase regulatory subunit [Candidatus Bathyarchaeota archaeon]